MNSGTADRRQNSAGVREGRLTCCLDGAAGVLYTRPVGRWYAEGLRDMEESVPMRDKTRETLPLFR